MKRMLKQLIYFTIPIILWIIAEGLLPSYTYTYRPWEALGFQTIFHLDRTFYPNIHIQMQSVGQLCHHTPYAIKKEETWITDSYGNRNNTFISNPDILIIGDSFAAGCSITQDSTLTNMLSQELKNRIKIYNIAPAEFSTLDNYLKQNIIKKPQLVILVKSENYIPRAITPYTKKKSLKLTIKDKLKNYPWVSWFSVILDKSFRLYSINWLEARITNKKGDGIPGIKKSKMFFYNYYNHGYDPNKVSNQEEDLITTRDNILGYKQYCDSIGINFLYIPIPSKSTIYYDYVPINTQPNYINKLDSMLRNENIKTINTLTLYNNYRQYSDNLLYHLDDNHWTPFAISLLCKKIVKTTYPFSLYTINN